MQPDEVRSLLRAYRENKARADYLEAEAENIAKAIVAENRPEMQAVHAQSYEYHPHTSAHSAPTENAVFRSFDGGGTAQAKAWAQELRQLEKARFDAVRVEVWLSGLTDKERKVITARYIDHLTWPAVAMNSDELIGYFMTPDGLRRIGRVAFEKICMIAR